MTSRRNVREDEELSTGLMALAQAARKTRLARGWTLEETAERADLDVRHVQQLEAGQGNPTALTLLRLCRGLGISVVDLLGAADQKPPVGPEPAPRRAPQASLADGGRPGPRQPKSPRGTRPPSSDQACSANVRRLRIARDWSQVELARRAGLSQGAIQSIEAGTKSPSLRTVEQVAGALGVAPWELVVSEGALAPKSRARVGRRS